MRYFVYKDSQIVGPLSADELQGLGGVEADALVCAEDASGRRDEDWRTAGEIAELSAGLRSSSPATALLDEPLPGAEAGVLERLELEALGVTRDEDSNWMAGFLDDAEFRTRWGFILPKGEDAPQDISLAQNKIRELSDQLSAFQKRIKELEAQQRDLLAQLRGNAQTGKFEALQAKPNVFAAPEPEAVTPPAPPPSAAEPALPSIAIRKEEPPPPPAAPPRAPETEFQKRAFKFTPPKPKVEAPKRGLPALGAAKSFKVIKKQEPPAPGPGAPVYEWNVSSQAPSAGLPEAKKAAPLPEAPAGPSFELPQPRLPSQSAPPPAVPPATVPPSPFAPPTPAGALPLNPPTPVPPPPVTMQLASPGAAPPTPAPGMGVPALEAPPVPTLTPLTPESAPPPMSPFAGPALAAAGPVYTPSRSNLEPPATATPVPAASPADDVLRRLARPEPPKTVEKPKPRNSKVFLIASGALVLVLIACFVFFLRRPKDLKNMVTLDDNHKKLGVEDDAQTQVFKPRAPETPAPQAQAPAPAPAPQVQAPNPAPTPAPAPPAVVDESASAIDLVKTWPLDGNRGTVGQWLTYSFTANPGSDNAEEWHAGAQAATIYAVEYRVTPGPRSSLKQPIVYVFEADLERKTVRGMNPPAHELMRGPKAAQAAPVKKKVRPAPKRRPKAQAAPAAPKEIPLMPLPSDTELLPPAEGDAQFKSDTVQ